MFGSASGLRSVIRLVENVFSWLFSPQRPPSLFMLPALSLLSILGAPTSSSRRSGVAGREHALTAGWDQEAVSCGSRSGVAAGHWDGAAER